MFAHLLKTYWNVWRGKHPVWIKEEDTFEYYADHKKWIRYGIVFCMFAFLVCEFLFFTSSEQQITYLDDKIHAANTIVAEKSFRYEDVDATRSARDNARNNSPICLEMLLSSNTKVVNSLITICKNLPKNPREINAWLDSAYHLDPVPAENLTVFLQLPEFQHILVMTVEGLLHQGYVTESFVSQFPPSRKVIIFVPPNRTLMEQEIGSLHTIKDLSATIARAALRKYSGKVEQSVREGLAQFLEQELEYVGGNLVYDELNTQVRAEENARKIPPVLQRVQSSENIIVRGQRVTDQDLLKLDAYNKTTSENQAITWRMIIQSLLVAFMCLFIVGLFVYTNCPELYKSSRNLLAYSVIMMIGIGVNTYIISNTAFLTNFLGSSLTSADLMLLGVSSILVTVTLGIRPGLTAGLFISLVTALQFGSNFGSFTAGIAVSCTACFFVVNAENYRSFFARMFVSLLGTLLILKFLALLYSGQIATLWQATIIGSVVSTTFTSVFSLLILFIMEWIFGLSTNMSYFTLTSVSHPLLKELQLVAPGTYHHCVNVETIAEQAAVEIHANPIMCRVLALYHDIGKVANPGYFTENIAPGHSPHAQISPSMSAMIIRGHVNEGVERAIRYKLPSIVRDGIAQHHGTDLVSYFYQQALGEGGSVDEALFRYPGPLPRKKEIVIVSLADACEAAARSIEHPTHAKIEAMVWEIFWHRLKVGQLNDAELTTREFTLVLESFVKTLTAMYHNRISYPKTNDADDLFSNASLNQSSMDRLTKGDSNV